MAGELSNALFLLHSEALLQQRLSWLYHRRICSHPCSGTLTAWNSEYLPPSVSSPPCTSAV